MTTATSTCRSCGKPSINPLRNSHCIVCELLHEPGCDGTGAHHGRHDCTQSGEPGAGCFPTCEACS